MMKTWARFLILAVLVVLAAQTLWVGMNLIVYSFEATEYSVQYEEIQEARSEFYNSSNPFINWLSNMSNNLIRVPFSLLIIASPFLYVMFVRKNKELKRSRRRTGVN